MCFFGQYFLNFVMIVESVYVYDILPLIASPSLAGPHLRTSNMQ